MLHLIALAAAEAAHSAGAAAAHPAEPNIWAEVITQLVAFLIFLWILKKYLWGPLTAMIDQRKAAIDQQFTKIDELQAQAAEIERQYQDKMKNIDADARRVVQEAVGEGQRVRDEIVERAKQEAEEFRVKQTRLLEMEVAKARIELRDHVVRMTVGATERLLRENLDHPRAEKLVSQFIEDVERMEPAGAGGKR